MDSTAQSACGIDWITLSTPYFPVVQGENSVSTKSPVPFYKYAVRYESGIMAHKGNPRSENWLVTVPGEALRKYQWDSSRAVEFLGARLNEGCKVSRLDMAVTIYDEHRRCTVAKFLDLIQQGRVRLTQSRIGHIKSIANEVGDRSVETVYIGNMKNRAKGGIVRIYDKGLEQDGFPGVLTRIEAEEKREVAATCARRIVETGAVGDVINTRIWFDFWAWKKATGGGFAPLTRSSEAGKDKDTWAWLIEQVAPALGRAIRDDEHNETQNRTRFFDEVWSSYQSHNPAATNRKLDAPGEGVVWC